MLRRRTRANSRTSARHHHPRRQRRRQRHRHRTRRLISRRASSVAIDVERRRRDRGWATDRPIDRIDRSTDRSIDRSTRADSTRTHPWTVVQNARAVGTDLEVEYSIGRICDGARVAWVTDVDGRGRVANSRDRSMVGRLNGWSVGRLKCWSVGRSKCWSVGRVSRTPRFTSSLARQLPPRRSVSCSP